MAKLDVEWRMVFDEVFKTISLYTSPLSLKLA